jgi:hypothetical protein
MEYLVLGVIPFLLGVAVALALRHHRRVLALVVVCAVVPYVLYARVDLAREGEYAGLGAIILGIIVACWLVGTATGALAPRIARRMRLS